MQKAISERNPVSHKGSRHFRRFLVPILICYVTAAVGACGNAEKNKIWHNQKALILAERGRYAEAIKELEKATEIDPDFADAYYEMGRCYAALKNFGPAISALETAKRIDSQFASKTALQIARIYNEGGQPSFAEQACLTALDSSPKDVALLTFLAALKRQEKEADEARSFLRQALSVDPGNVDALLLASEIDMQEHEYASAEKHLKKILAEAEPKNVKAQLALAQIYRLTDRPGEALELLEKAVADNSDIAAVHAALADAYLSENRLQEARKEAEVFLQAMPASAGAQALMGTVALKLHDYKTAVVHLTQATNTPDAPPEMHYMLGIALQQNGEPAQAVSAFQKSLVFQPDNIAYRIALAEALLANGTFESAERELERVLSLQPENRQAQKLLDYAGALKEAYEHIHSSLVSQDVPQKQADLLVKALKAFRAGDLETTKTFCEDVLKSSPSSPEALNLLGLMKLRKNDAEQALHYFRLASDADPDFVPSYVNLANIYMSIGSVEHAVELFRKAVAIAPDNKIIQLKFARALVLMKRNTEAESILQNLLNSDPDKLTYRLRLASLYADSGRYVDAQKELAEILRVEPSHKTVRFLLAEAYAKAGNLVEASKEFEKLLEADKTSDLVRTRLAFCHLASGKTADAKKLLLESDRAEGKDPTAQMAVAMVMLREKAYPDAEEVATSLLTESPDEPAFQLMLMNTHALLHTLKGPADFGSGHSGSSAFLEKYEQMLQNGDLEPDAITELSLALALEHMQWRRVALTKLEALIASGSNNSSLLELTGNLCEKEGWPDKATSYYRLATTSDPSYWPAHYKLGFQYLTQGNVAEAKTCFLAALREKPDALMPLLGLARIYERTHDEGAALEAYKKIHTLYPDQTFILNNLAWILAKNPKTLDQAMEFAKKAANVYPLKPEIQDTLGWIWFQKKEYENSLHYLERAVIFDPVNPSIRYHRGMSYFMAGQKKEALQDFEFADSYPDFPEKQLNQHMLHRVNQELQS